ncbi:hypothetical protein C6N75_09275 [Streptomyces solincola]|uniref:Uncharacterized protein n=1 Tax=Streptomyces solincola TaxID=2100817 RepID=A0A2S9PYJ4_9ACTN|nr:MULTISPECIES: hypothetical protein [Streptomyces]PRH79491.1 hypothetical protein C6N75_09275 [Streptomyces solincola]
MDDETFPADGDDWPIPPAWMWGCEGCVELYSTMKSLAAEPPPPPGAAEPAEGAGSAQVRLARHIAAEHRAELPAYAGSCTRCVDYQTRTARDRAMGRSTLTTEQLGRQHRARHAFVPHSTVHLL